MGGRAYARVSRRVGETGRQPSTGPAVRRLSACFAEHCQQAPVVLQGFRNQGPPPPSAGCAWRFLMFERGLQLQDAMPKPLFAPPVIPSSCLPAHCVSPEPDSAHSAPHARYDRWCHGGTGAVAGNAPVGLLVAAPLSTLPSPHYVPRRHRRAGLEPGLDAKV